MLEKKTEMKLVLLDPDIGGESTRWMLIRFNFFRCQYLYKLKY